LIINKAFSEALNFHMFVMRNFKQMNYSNNMFEFKLYCFNFDLKSLVFLE